MQDARGDREENASRVERRQSEPEAREIFGNGWRNGEREREIYIFLWLQLHVTGPRHHLASSLRIRAQGDMTRGDVSTTWFTGMVSRVRCLVAYMT